MAALRANFTLDVIPASPKLGDINVLRSLGEALWLLYYWTMPVRLGGYFDGGFWVLLGDLNVKP